MGHSFAQYKRKGRCHAPNTLEESVFAEKSKNRPFVVL